jgi:hypothetical protein
MDHDSFTIQRRLVTVATRIRERAVGEGHFTPEVAADVETLASIAASLIALTERLRQLLDDLDTLAYVVDLDG